MGTKPPVGIDPMCYPPTRTPLLTWAWLAAAPWGGPLAQFLLIWVWWCGSRARMVCGKMLTELPMRRRRGRSALRLCGCEMGLVTRYDLCVCILCLWCVCARVSCVIEITYIHTHACMHTDVYMHAYIYVCTRAWMYVGMDVVMYVSMYVCVYACVHVHVHVHVYLSVYVACTHIHTHAYIHTYAYMHMHATHTCICMCACVCVCICIWVWYNQVLSLRALFHISCACIQIHTHTHKYAHTQIHTHTHTHTHTRITHTTNIINIHTQDPSLLLAMGLADSSVRLMARSSAPTADFVHLCILQARIHCLCMCVCATPCH